MGFFEVAQAGQNFSENTSIFGESFTYTAPNGGATTSGLIGVMNQVELEYQFDEFSTKKIAGLVVISSKTQWGAVVPGDRGVITYGSVTYQIEKVDGTSTGGEPAFSLTCKKLT